MTKKDWAQSSGSGELPFIGDLGAILPSKVIKGMHSTPTKGKSFSDFTPQFMVDNMDLKEVVELLMDEIDKLNKRVRELER